MFSPAIVATNFERVFGDGPRWIIWPKVRIAWRVAVDEGDAKSSECLDATYAMNGENQLQVAV